MYARHYTPITWDTHTTIAALFLLTVLIALYITTRPQNGHHR